MLTGPVADPGVRCRPGGEGLRRLMGMRRLHRVLLVVLLGVVVACSAPVAGRTSPPPPTSPSPVSPPAVGATVPDPAALCNGYLVLLRSGDDGPLREALDDPAVLEDLDTMLGDVGEFAAIAEAALRVEGAVLDRCADRFAAGTVPAPDDSTALSRFMAAIQAGDEAAAERVAWANVVAQVPWVPDGPQGFSFQVSGSTATALMGRSTMIVCHARAGVVVTCTFAPA